MDSSSVIARVYQGEYVMYVGVVETSASGFDVATAVVTEREYH